MLFCLPTSLIATNAATGRSRRNREIETDRLRLAGNSSSIRLCILIITLREFFFAIFDARITFEEAEISKLSMVQKFITTLNIDRDV